MESSANEELQEITEKWRNELLRKARLTIDKEDP